MSSPVDRPRGARPRQATSQSSLSQAISIPSTLKHDASPSPPTRGHVRLNSDATSPLVQSNRPKPLSLGSTSNFNRSHPPSNSSDWATATIAELGAKGENEDEVPLLPITPTTQSRDDGRWRPQRTLHDYSDPFNSPAIELQSTPNPTPGPSSIIFDSERVGDSPYSPTPPRGARKATPPKTNGHRSAYSLDATSPNQNSFNSFNPYSGYEDSPAASPDPHTGHRPFRLMHGRNLPRPQTWVSTTQRKHPFGRWFSTFEYPQFRKLVTHTFLCVISYPFLLVFVTIARHRDLFWNRLFVGAGCGLLGVMLGITLLKLARGIIEAATWATVIHQSRVPEGAGVRLKDLAEEADDHASAMSALKLIWDRHQYPGADRNFRRFYDSRFWTLWICYFLFNVALAGVLPFALARIVDIDVQIERQFVNYRETVVKGDLTEADIARARELAEAFEDYRLTWTLAPFTVHGGLPPVVSFQWKDDLVYFSEVIQSQLQPNGSGFGTFETTTTSRTMTSEGNNGGWTQGSEVAEIAAPRVELEPGSVLRFPRWGIRIKCAKIPNTEYNILPMANSTLTYLFTPHDTLRPLFSWFNMPYPAILDKPLNATAILQGNDTLPEGLDVDKTALSAIFWDNGVAHSTKSTPLTMGEEGTGFVTLENVLVRMNTTYAPNGTFPQRSDQSLPNEDGIETWIGYDAAVCLELYEPWVVEVYNSSVGVPTSMKIVSKGPIITDENIRVNEFRMGAPLDDAAWGGNVTRSLNSSLMRDPYIAGHQNSVNQLVKDNGRDAYYVPSPTLVSLTDGHGPYGYTTLSETAYGQSRVLADASNVLPYFAGSGPMLARSYPDKKVTTASINKLQFLMIITGVFVIGCISAFFVPKLPMDMPRRGFDLYSWMTAFAANELVPVGVSGLGKQMDLRDIQMYAGDLKFRYVA